jgi:hypothetical protein
MLLGHLDREELPSNGFKERREKRDQGNLPKSKVAGEEVMRKHPAGEQNLNFFIRVAAAVVLALCLGAGAWAQQEQQDQKQQDQQQAQQQNQSQDKPPATQDSQAKPSYAPQDADKPPYSRDRIPQNKPTPDRSMPSQPRQNQPQQNGPVQNGPVQNGPMQNGQDRPAQNQAGQNSTEGQYQQVPPTLTIPAGTVLTVRINEFLSSDKNQIGDHFTAELERPIVVNGWVVARRGQTLEGQVKDAKKAGRVKGTSELGVELTDMTLVDGKQAPILTQLWKGSGGTSHGADAATIGGTTALGAAIGAAADWGRGAAIGAGAGAVAGIGAVLLTRGRPTILDPETELSFRLEDPVKVDTAQSRQAFLPVTQEDFDGRSDHRRPRLAAGYPAYPYYPCGYYGSCYAYPGFVGIYGGYGWGPRYYGGFHGFGGRGWGGFRR